MKVELEIHTKMSPQLQEVRDFWIHQWTQTFSKLISQNADPHIFASYDYHYALRFDGRLGGIMSSTWQSLDQNFDIDPYYQPLPKPNTTLGGIKMQRFHKMGMIAADLSVVPKGFKLTRVIIGCGMKFTKNELSQCEGVVSFPRRDTSVYQACIEWGAKTHQSDLIMHNAPVHFIVLRHCDLLDSHTNDSINHQVRDLWAQWQKSQYLSLSA